VVTGIHSLGTPGDSSIDQPGHHISAPTPLTETMVIPGYDILDELGHGGMAIVYLARHLETSRLVALKVMVPGLARDRTFTRRFLKEGRIIASLDDPRIVSIFDSGVHQNQYFICMEYLPGGTLKRRIQQGLTLEDSLAIIRTVAAGLDHAHERHLVHRDIKPQNILFRSSREPVLTDFGIAKSLEGNTAITRSGQFLGSPQYMSPEQAKGLSVDTRSDIYSLGIVFYEMLTGRIPYTAEDNIALAIKHITEPIPLLPLPLAHFQPVLDRLLTKHPNQRFQNIHQFLAMLDLAERRYTASFGNSRDATTPLPPVGEVAAPTHQATVARTVAAGAPTSTLTALTALTQTRIRPAPGATANSSTWDATTGITTVMLGTVLGGSLLALLGRGLGELLHRRLGPLSVELSQLVAYGVMHYAAQGIFLLVVVAALLASAFSHQHRSIWSVLRGDRRGGRWRAGLGGAMLDVLRWLLAGMALGMAGTIVLLVAGHRALSLTDGALLGVLTSGLTLTVIHAWRFGQWAGNLIGGQLRVHLQDLD